MTPERAWYLRVAPSEVGERALLVGDRGRIDRIAERLDDPVLLNEDRGLRTVTGNYQGVRVTAAAFGMGAPIAAIVLDELASIGVKTFLRLGTVMCFEREKMGEMVLAEAAVRGESTSATYVCDGFPAYADFDLQVATRAALRDSGARWRAGVYATYDGFYTDMLPWRSRDRQGAEAAIAQLRGLGVVGLDMETSAVLTVARAVGSRCGSLCAATVAWEGAERLGDAERVEAERQLINIGLEALVRDASATEKG